MRPCVPVATLVHVTSASVEHTSGALVEEIRARRRLPSPALRRALRREAGIAQDAAASHIGVHRVTLARWESGATPRAKHLGPYLRFLDTLEQEAAS